MDQEDFDQALTKSKTQILDCKQVISNLGDKTVLSEIEDVLKELNTIKTNHINQITALKSMPAPKLDENTEQLYQEALEKCQTENGPISPDESSSDENEDASFSTAELGDRSFILSQVDGIPIDPITKNQVRDPGRNTICNHVYEHDIILQYIKQMLKNKRNKKVRCPYIGCNNKNLTPENIVKDDDLKKKIIVMMNTESVNPNASIVSIS